METAYQRYVAGLKAGWLDASNGNATPEGEDGDPYLVGWVRGAACWARELDNSMVIDEPPRAEECRW